MEPKLIPFINLLLCHVIMAAVNMTHMKRLFARLLASWPKTEDRRKKRSQCTAALINIVPKLCSSFLHSEKVSLCSFIVTNYSGMEDSAPQLRLTGNFQDSLKIWITSSTLCMGLNSEIQTSITLVPTFTLTGMYLYLFALS